MNDTLREYFSYGKFLIPLLTVKKEIVPDEYRWNDKKRYFLFFPSPCKKKDTLVIYIHGGGWNSNSPKQHFFIGQKIALGGYDCIMPDYRKTPKYRYDDISADIFGGYANIKTYIKEKGLSYSKIVVMGSSAGAHLGALLCFDREKQIEYGISEDEFDGFISMAGPLCFDYPETGALNTLLKMLFNSKEISEWKKGEPYSKLTSSEKMKILLIQSRHDGLVGFDQAVAFKNKASELGMETELYEVTDKWNTHTAYCAGVFLKERSDFKTLDKVFLELDSI